MYAWGLMAATFVFCLYTWSHSQIHGIKMAFVLPVFVLSVRTPLGSEMRRVYESNESDRNAW